MNNIKLERYLHNGRVIVDNHAANLIHAMDAQNAILALNLGQHAAEALDKHAVSFIAAQAEPTLCPFGTELIARCDEVNTLPINRLGELQGLLVDLMAFIVNHETEDGKLTAAVGNKALESMPYWNSLDVYTKEAGFKCLGNGHFSLAYSHPKMPGKVIKVGLKKEDSGAAYVAFCRMHQGRVGIPVIHDVQRHKGCYTVVMDHLKCAQDATRGEVLLADHYKAVREAVETGCAPDCTNADAYLKELCETGEMINKFFKGIARFDMHRGNVMLDKAGNLIVTDPVSFSHDDREFSVNPEDLLAEVEVIAQAAMIKRCKARWMKHQPWAITVRKQAKKAKKAEFKKHRVEEVQMHREQDRLDALWVAHERAEEIAGVRAWGRIHWRNRQGAIINIKDQLVAKEHYEIQKALVGGRQLPMDARLDAQFFRG